jgi:hypothetical protein
VSFLIILMRINCIQNLSGCVRSPRMDISYQIYMFKNKKIISVIPKSVVVIQINKLIHYAHVIRLLYSFCYMRLNAD